MITNSEFALLALDSYNRGYDPKLTPAGQVVGRFSIVDDFPVPAESFYAVAYQSSDGYVISYRGTDNPDLNPFTGGKGDISTGWVGGGGTWTASQFKLAHEFYDRVLAISGDDPVYLTGHSLGGGLAGFVATLRDEKAVVFDNMPYKLAADNAYAVALLANKFESVFSEDIDTLNDALKATSLAVLQMTGDAANFVLQLTNTLNPFSTPVSISSEAFETAKSFFTNGVASAPTGNIESFAISGEILDIIRISVFYGTEYFDGIFGASERSDFAYSIDTIGREVGEFVFDGATSSIKSYFADRTDAHSMSLLTAHLDLDEKVVSYQNDVSFLGHALVESLFDDDIASLTGHGNADKMLSAIAYSAHASIGAPFGDSSLDAIFSDASDVGSVLDGNKYNWNLRATWKPNDFLIREDLADQIVQFSAGLANNASAPAEMSQGFIRSTIHGATDVLTIDYSQALWGNAFGNASFATSLIIGKDGQNNILDILDIDGFLPNGLLLNNIEWGALKLYGSRSMDRLERVHYFSDDDLSSGVNIDLASIDQTYTVDGNRYTSFLTRFDFISGTEFNDSITGSDRNEIIEGGDGSDTLQGGAGNDLLVASSGNSDVDYLDGGAGDDWAVFSRDLNDYNITALGSSHEYDFWVRELDLIQNPFTKGPDFTGNEVYLKDVQYGVFDGGETYEFGADGPTGEQSANLQGSDGTNIGVVTIEAPTYGTDSNIDFSLNLSTSGVGTQYRVALIIDVSGSMGGSRITDAKAAYVHLINYLKDQGIADVTEFAVIPFQSSATLYEGLSADEAIARINSLSAGGGTEFGSAISRGLEFFDGAQAGLTQIAYFLSDGQGNGASTALQAVADVRAFGIGSGASISSLNTIDSNNAVILNSASDLAASFTESEIKTADVDKIEVYLNGNLIETITGDQLTDNGATGLSYSGTIDGLNPSAADTLEAKVYFKDTSIPVQSVAFEVGDGTTEATGTDGDDRIAFSMSQQSVDAGGGTDTVLANNLDNTVIKITGNGVIKTFGGNDTVLAGDNRTSGLDRVIDGGDGTDTVVYVGNFSEYNVSRTGGLIKVGTATDSLSNVEFLQFDDVKVRTSDLSVVQTLSASSVEVIESDTGAQITFTISLDAASSSDVSFDFATANGTAEAGRDFTATSGTITLLAGETQKTITVDVTGDTEFEGDETFELQLSNASGAVFDGGGDTYSITGTIKNDDDANQVETGSASDDVINTGKGNDQINSGAGNDVVSANLGNDIVIDGLGNDSLNGDGGNDAVMALSGINALQGGNGSDYLAGGFQADNLSGGAGNDVLRGDLGGFLGGSDILIGGADDDFLMGGRGADTFIFNTNDGTDIIAAFDTADIGYGPLSGYTATANGSDFQAGVDQINLRFFDGVNSSNVMDFVSDSTDGARFSAEGTDILFYGVAASQISADDFLFTFI